MKVCNNITSPDYCQNIYDLIGCAYNMPSDSYTRTDFTDCQGDLQMPPGLYVSNGQTMTWSQPASLTPGSTLPWQPSIPASSSCTTYTSAQLYAQETGSLSATTTASGQAATSITGSSQHGSTARPTATNTTSGAMINSVRLGSLVVILVSLFAILSSV
jgi:hypothetical protein